MKIRKLDEKFLFEMAAVGTIKDYTLYIRSKEGPKAHFHIVDTATLGDEFHTCVRIDCCEYFHHTGKEDVLNSKERRLLVDFVNEESEDWETLTNFDVMVRLWNQNNPSYKLDKQIPVPNYNML